MVDVKPLDAESHGDHLTTIENRLDEMSQTLDSIYDTLMQIAAKMDEKSD